MRRAAAVVLGTVTGNRTARRRKGRQHVARRRRDGDNSTAVVVSGDGTAARRPAPRPGAHRRPATAGRNPARDRHAVEDEARPAPQSRRPARPTKIDADEDDRHSDSRRRPRRPARRTVRTRRRQVNGEQVRDAVDDRDDLRRQDHEHHGQRRFAFGETNCTTTRAPRLSRRRSPRRARTSPRCPAQRTRPTAYKSSLAGDLEFGEGLASRDGGRRCTASRWSWARRSPSTFVDANADVDGGGW